MKAVLKQLHSPDVIDLNRYAPQKYEPFSCLVQAMFSPEGVDGAESFDVVVCNPPWLVNEIRKYGPKIGRHYLIVEEFNLDEVRRVIINFAEECVGDTWDEIAIKLSRLGHWEFEDYRPC